jgi:hypothetical protein
MAGKRTQYVVGAPRKFTHHHRTDYLGLTATKFEIIQYDIRLPYTTYRYVLELEQYHNRPRSEIRTPCLFEYIT